MTVKAHLPKGLLSNMIQHNVVIVERFPAHTSLCKWVPHEEWGTNQASAATYTVV